MGVLAELPEGTRARGGRSHRLATEPPSAGGERAYQTELRSASAPRQRGGYRERASRCGRGAVLWSRADTSVDHPRTTDAERLPARRPYRVLPDGCMDLIWSQEVGGLLVAGPDTRAYVSTGSSGAAWAGLRFAPGTGPSVLGVPAAELRDLRVPLAELWPADRVRRLTDHVNAASDHGMALEQVVLRVAEDSERPDPLCQELLAGVRGGLRVSELAHAVGVSERQLHRRALAAFGYGPKTLGRVLRMREALQLATRGVPFAQVAAETGYADQAHLAREVRALAGLPLSELLAESGHQRTPGSTDGAAEAL